MPIFKGCKDIKCFKCLIYIDNPRIWSFTSLSNQTYVYALCQFCTIECDTCGIDIVSTGLNFATVSVIKNVNITICKKCIDKRGTLKNT